MSPMCERTLTMAALADDLREIATPVICLVLDRRDPEHFHIAKHEAATRLTALARRIEAERA